MHNCTHFSPCTGQLTIFQKWHLIPRLYAQPSPKIPFPIGERHVLVLTTQACLIFGFKSAQNITFNPRCLGHSKGSYWLKANVANAHGCLVTPGCSLPKSVIVLLCGHSFVNCYLLHQYLHITQT
jgi:hypothetical protein